MRGPFSPFELTDAISDSAHQRMGLAVNKMNLEKYDLVLMVGVPFLLGPGRKGMVRRIS